MSTKATEAVVRIFLGTVFSYMLHKAVHNFVRFFRMYVVYMHRDEVDIPQAATAFLHRMNGSRNEMRVSTVTQTVQTSVKSYNAVQNDYMEPYMDQNYGDGRNRYITDSSKDVGSIQIFGHSERIWVLQTVYEGNRRRTYRKHRCETGPGSVVTIFFIVKYVSNILLLAACYCCSEFVTISYSKTSFQSLHYPVLI